jgi:asparagine synthase (glutamine-hydrolysing)
MCGIVGIFEIREPSPVLREQALKMAARVRHRGPDWSGIYAGESAIIAHERLSIVDVEHGAQPLVDRDTGAVLGVNGEIYNHVALRKQLKKRHSWQTKSDCEVILYLYDEYGPEFLNLLSGIFAFVLYDSRKNDYFIARDLPAVHRLERQRHGLCRERDESLERCLRARGRISSRPLLPRQREEVRTLAPAGLAGDPAG